MKAPGGLGRRWRKWPFAVVCVAVALPLTVSGSGVATSAEASSRQPLPVINPGYLYSQLYTMATSFSYRISGADGPPQDPSSAFNLPPTVNGWQELFAYWKKTLTDDRANGQLALVAAHPDETPVPAGIVNEINSGSTSGATGFDAARRAITDSNLGNEGAYDGLTGVALTMGEYHALLGWYEANGTYPDRTLKVTLLDASRGLTSDGLFGREGSSYYANNLIPAGPQGQYLLFANMDS